MLALRILPTSCLVCLTALLVGCGATAPAASEDVANTEEALVPCAVDKLAFQRGSGCKNDGFVEFCVPADDEALQDRILAIAPNVKLQPSRGRAQCDTATQRLVMFPTPAEDRAVCTSKGGLRTAPWRQICRIADEPAVTRIVPTFFE